MWVMCEIVRINEWTSCLVDVLIVAVSICHGFGLSTYWVSPLRFVDVLTSYAIGYKSKLFVVCRRFSLSTFRLVDVLTSHPLDNEIGSDGIVI